MSDFKEIAVRNRQNGVSGEQTGRDLFALSPNGPLEDVVEALAFAGFPPRDTIMGATQYSTSLYPGESEYTHRQVIIDKMKAVAIRPTKSMMPLPTFGAGRRFLSRKVSTGFRATRLLNKSRPRVSKRRSERRARCSEHGKSRK